MTKQRLLEIGAILLFIVVVAVISVSFWRVDGVGANVNGVENECTAYPYPTCGCSAYPSDQSYPYPYPTDCNQFLPAITVPYPNP